MNRYLQYLMTIRYSNGLQLSVVQMTLNGRVASSNFVWFSMNNIQTWLPKYNLPQKCSIQTFIMMVKYVWTFFKTIGLQFMMFSQFWFLFNSYFRTQIISRLLIMKLVNFIKIITGSIWRGLKSVWQKVRRISVMKMRRGK